MFPCTISYLSFLVDSHNTRGGWLIRSNKDSVITDTIHKDTNASFKVVDMDEAHLGKHINDTETLANLHGYGEISWVFRSKEHLGSLLGEWRIVVWMIDFNDLQLRFAHKYLVSCIFKWLMNVYLGVSSDSAYTKGEQFGRLRSVFKLYFGKSSSVTFNRLTDTTFSRIKLHGSHYTSLLWRDTNQHHPVAFAWCAIIDNLTSCQVGVSIKHLDWSRAILHWPMIHSCSGHDTNCLQVNPFPKGDVVVHKVRADLSLCLEIEHLKLALCYVHRQYRCQFCPLKINDIHYLPLNAIILVVGCVITDSAVIGRRIMSLLLARSIITTWFWPFTCSRTHTNRSDSKVSVWNPTLAALTPNACS